MKHTRFDFSAHPEQSKIHSRKRVHSLLALTAVAALSIPGTQLLMNSASVIVPTNAEAVEPTAYDGSDIEAMDVAVDYASDESVTVDQNGDEPMQEIQYTTPEAQVTTPQTTSIQTPNTTDIEISQTSIMDDDRVQIDANSADTLANSGAGTMSLILFTILATGFMLVFRAPRLTRQG